MHSWNITCCIKHADLNPVDYAIWSVIQQRVYETRVHDIDELWQRLHFTVYCICGAARSSRWLQLTNGERACCLCSCQWQTFWTYFVTIKLFSLYLMNFMFHNMLDAACNILRLHYKSMKCDVSFSLGSVGMLFRWGGHFCHMCVKHFFVLTTVQKI